MEALAQGFRAFNKATRSISVIKTQNGLNMNARRSVSVYNSPSEISTKKVTLIPGDGIGPEITDAVVGVFQAADVPIVWERFDDTYEEASSNYETYFKNLTASIARNRVALKGPLYTPGHHVVSRNLQLRTSLDLFANVVPCASNSGIKTRHSGTPIDLVVIRENTQGEYAGFEQEVSPGVVQCLKVVTEYATRRIAEYAFQYAVKEGRKKVTAIHKANIQKQTDGLFLKICREVSQKYPNIKYNEMIIDNCCMQLVMNPAQFDVMVTGNLYGNIISNVASGLVGGAGVVGGVNVGEQIAIFETGARHLALDIAGQNKANPLAFLYASVSMLKYLGLDKYAEKIEKAVSHTINTDKVLTSDIGGTATTRLFTQSVISNLNRVK